MPSRVEADVLRVLDLLEAHAVRATFFVLGEVARAHPRVVARIAQAGHEVACHGFHHIPVDLLSAEEFAADLDLAIEAVGAATGSPPVGYRAPLWSLSRAAWRASAGVDALVSRGFRYDSSLVAVPPLGTAGLPVRPAMLRGVRTTIAEFPPLTGRFGFWRFPLGFGLGLRFWPASHLTRRIAAENAAGFPAVVAFHPWELDPDPPVLRLSPPLAVAHGFGIEKLPAKLGALLRAVSFGTVRDGSRLMPRGE